MDRDLPPATRSASLSTPDRDIWKIDALRARVGGEFEISFESADPAWRQGVWLGVDGILEIGFDHVVFVIRERASVLVPDGE